MGPRHDLLNRAARAGVLACATIMGLTVAQAQAQDLRQPAGVGLMPRSDTPVWPRLQARVLTIPAASLPADARLVVDTASGLGRTPGLVGDVYFTSSLLGPRVIGGFRATSGLLLGGGLSVPAEDRLDARGDRWAGPMAERFTEGLLPRTAGAGGQNLPYMGIGYSGFAAQGGWGIVADLGLVAGNPGALRLGRAWQSSQAVDDLVRELRLTPLVRLGVSYAF